MVYVFDDYSLDTDRRELRRRGRLVPVQPQVFDLLRYLISQRHRVVSKDDLIGAIWRGRIVSESTLSSRITGVRQAIRDSGGEQRLIRTVPRRGLRFVGEVYEQQSPTAPDLQIALQPGFAAFEGSAAVEVGETIARARMSIVVLPFANLGNDPEQQYFADGITEDLTTDLSRIVDMFVISRNTAFTYRNKPIDTKQVGRELGVRYVLQGSVRRSGSQVRINAQVIDAETDGHVWAGRFDRDTSDLFALQDDITSQIAVALNVALIATEAARPTEHAEALDYIFRGRAAGWKPHSVNKYAEQISLFERALVLNPRSVEAQSHLASALMSRVMSGMAGSAAADIARAEGLVRQALAASPRSPLAHYAKGQVLRAQRRFEEAIPEYETVLAHNRNVVGALHPLGQCKLFAGSIEETIPLEEKAIRLSPRDPELLGVWYSQIGLVHLLQSRTDQAIVWFERARSANPERPDIHANLAAAYALKGDRERAAAELAEARGLNADDRYTSVARLKAVGYWGVPNIRALFEATYFGALRMAGMPEE